MENSPELIQKAKYLGTITKDFADVASLLKEASYALRKRKISLFPIFPMCKENMSIGQLLIAKDEKKLTWNFYFSFMEELLERKIIEKKEVFQQSYKDPDEFCCLFVVDKDFINFVYLPYPLEE